MQLRFYMIELMITLIVFLFPFAYSPGPGNMFFAANGARFGFAATINASVGYHLATWLVTFFIGLSFSWVTFQFPVLVNVIKYVGSAYVFYLAWTFFQAGMVQYAIEPRKVGFFDGVILLLLNPKAYLIIGLMFSQFIDDADQNSTKIILWITTIFTLNNWISFTLWTYVGDRILSRYRTDNHARSLNILFGVILAVVALWMLFN